MSRLDRAAIAAALTEKLSATPDPEGIADLVAKRDAVAAELRGAVDGTAQRSAQQLADATARANGVIAEAGK